MILICIDTKEVIFLTQCWCGTASVLWRKNKSLWFASWTLLPPRRVVSPLVKWPLDHHQCFAGPPGRARWDHGFNQLVTVHEKVELDELDELDGLVTVRMSLAARRLFESEPKTSVMSITHDSIFCWHLYLLYSSLVLYLVSLKGSTSHQSYGLLARCWYKWLHYIFEPLWQQKLCFQKNIIRSLSFRGNL